MHLNSDTMVDGRHCGVTGALLKQVSANCWTTDFLGPRKCLVLHIRSSPNDLVMTDGGTADLPRRVVWFEQDRPVDLWKYAVFR
jgi:hypothetical protein